MGFTCAPCPNVLSWIPYCDLESLHLKPGIFSSDQERFIYELVSDKKRGKMYVIWMKVHSAYPHMCFKTLVWMITLTWTKFSVHLQVQFNSVHYDTTFTVLEPLRKINAFAYCILCVLLHVQTLVFVWYFFSLTGTSEDLADPQLGVSPMTMSKTG